ncbi:MAG: hypothetical protein M1816_002486 [Peltula sp. TS41687]|nr:MAG: hypothetical protein M1816_002486 [Peltula sp. TS41687]
MYATGPDFDPWDALGLDPRDPTVTEESVKKAWRQVHRHVFHDRPGTQGLAFPPSTEANVARDYFIQAPGTRGHDLAQRTFIDRSPAPLPAPLGLVPIGHRPQVNPPSSRLLLAPPRSSASSSSGRLSASPASTSSAARPSGASAASGASSAPNSASSTSTADPVASSTSSAEPSAFSAPSGGAAASSGPPPGCSASSASAADPTEANDASAAGGTSPRAEKTRRRRSLRHPMDDLLCAKQPGGGYIFDRSSSTSRS